MQMDIKPFHWTEHYDW